jgi:hypothetical protein
MINHGSGSCRTKDIEFPSLCMFCVMLHIQIVHCVVRY